MRNKNVIANDIKNDENSPARTSMLEPEVVQLIIFNLGEEEFCVDVDQIKEIINVGVITPVPDSPNFIKGMTNVRGEIILAIDIKTRFFLHTEKETESKHIIITRQEKNPFGLIVDEVTEVLRISEMEIKPVPGLVSKMDKEYISGVVTIENRLITLLDLTRVLSEKELIRLSEVSESHLTAEEHQEKKVKNEADADLSSEDQKVGKKETASKKGKKG